MATSRTCPYCRRWHEMTMACPFAAVADALRNGSGQSAADAAEEAAVLRYLGLDVHGEQNGR